MSTTYIESDDFLSLPVKDWLLYAYTVVCPFFVFSVFFSRDTPANWVIALMLLLMLIDVVKSGGDFWTDVSFVYLLILFAFYLISTTALLIEDPTNTWAGRTPLERAIGIDVRVLIVVIAFLAFVHHLADAPPHVFSRILKIQFLVGVLMALFGLMQYISYTVFHSSALVGIESTNEAFSLRTNFFIVGKERVFRTSAVFSEPSYFGFFLIPLLVKSVVAYYEGLYFGSRSTHVLMILTFLLALLSNFSFTGILTLVGLAFLFGIVYSRKAPKVALGIGLITIGFVAALVLSPIGGVFLTRFENIIRGQDLSTVARVLSAYLGFVVFLDNPLFGVGPGGFAFLYAKMGILVGRNQMHTPLNAWFSILTDVGIVGFVPFCALLWSILRRAIRNLNRHPLIVVYLWSAVSYLFLITTADLWFLDMFWFELAILLTLGVSPMLNPPKTPELNLKGTSR